MKTPSIPVDERARLETLRSIRILDTPPEERFDRLTRIARRIFGVPIALVSLVDEHRQWFKSSFGVNVTETPREVSFCGHAILGDDSFVIHDASEDERFADNPLVVGHPHVRFYAGCPLKLDGLKLGTLCLIDKKPRILGKEDLKVLKDLASLVEGELEAVQLATLDELTHISNRRGFVLLAKYSLHFCARRRVPASLVFFDLDKFKSINDAFGHAEGDRALIAFADQIKRAGRDSDIFARLGGDEFVALLSSTSPSMAESFVARFGQSLAAYNREASRGYDITFSYGVVGFDPGRPTSIDEMLATGDAQMYQLKRSRRR